MIEIAYDPSLHLLCGIVAGVRTNAENEKLVAAITDLDRHGVAHKHVVAFALELTPGSQPPDAHWRRRLALQRQGMKAPRVFTSIITTSTVLRGVLTAMNWVSPPPPHVKAVHHAARDEAAAWIEIVHGVPIHKTRNLFAQISGPTAVAR
jgi:hypothetical protein